MSPAADTVAQAACRRLLAASRGLVRFSGQMSLVSVALLWLWAGAMAPRFPEGAGLLFASLCCGLAAQYYGFRVRLDADLFALVEPPGQASAADFAAGIDAFRAGLGGSPIPGLLGDRYGGALALWRRLAAALGLQAALLLGATGAACWAALAGG